MAKQNLAVIARFGSCRTKQSPRYYLGIATGKNPRNDLLLLTSSISASLLNPYSSVAFSLFAIRTSFTKLCASRVGSGIR